MKNYPVPTADQIGAVRECFANVGVVVEASSDGYYVTATQMRSYIEFSEGLSVLTAYQTIAKLLGCENGNEIDRSASEGCPTCGYGSQYEIRLRFW